MCVQNANDQCVLQFTLLLAAGCVLHRRTSRAIHHRELYLYCFRGLELIIHVMVHNLAEACPREQATTARAVSSRFVARGRPRGIIICPIQPRCVSGRVQHLKLAPSLSARESLWILPVHLRKSLRRGSLALHGRPIGWYVTYRCDATRFRAGTTARSARREVTYAYDFSGPEHGYPDKAFNLV